MKDNEGNTPTHTAAATGNVYCVKHVVEKGGNIWALNDSGQTPATVAASRRRADCFKYLDSLSVHVQMENKGVATKMQEKARKDAEKRLKQRRKSAGSGAASDAKDRKTSFSRLVAASSQATSGGGGESFGQRAKTMTKLPSDTQIFSRVGIPKAGTVSGYRHQAPARRSTSSGELGLAPQRMTLGNFVLKPAREEEANDGGGLGANTSREYNEEEGDEGEEEEEEEEEKRAEESPKEVASDDNDEADGISEDPPAENVVPESRRIRSQSGSVDGGRRSSSVSREKRRVPAIDVETALSVRNPLRVFLTALDLDDLVSAFTSEMMDLDALLLCSDDDFREIRIPLGPRKKLLASIKDRKNTIADPGQLRCTSL